jgi:DNA-binding NarL/FixJ family response regulator
LCSPAQMDEMNTCSHDVQSGKTRILVVDDHCIVRRGLTELLNQQLDLTVGAAVGNAEQALEAVRQGPFDLAIVDISLGETDGIELTNKLTSEHPEMVVLILSMHEEEQYADRALRAGASGFVTKQQAGNTLLTAIHRVLKGEHYFSHTHRQIA